MSLVYGTLLALVPLLAFVVAILKAIGLRHVLEPNLKRALAPLGAAGPAVAAHLLRFVDHVQAGVLGAVGLIMLIYTVMSLIHKIEAGLNESWYIIEARPIVRRIVEFASVLLAGPLLLALAFGLTAALANRELTSRLATLGPLLVTIGNVLPYLLVIGAFTFIYQFVPNTRVKWLYALIGGVIAGAGWQSAGIIFTILTQSSARLTVIYSGFAIVILFMIWLYISWLILLIGARIAFYLQNPEWLEARYLQHAALPATLELAGLTIMVDAVQRAIAGTGPITLTHITVATRLSPPQLRPLIKSLVEAGLLQRSGTGYVPGQNPAITTAADVIKVVRGTPAPPPINPFLASLWPDFLRAEAAREHYFSGHTLEQLANDAVRRGRRHDSTTPI